MSAARQLRDLGAVGLRDDANPAEYDRLVRLGLATVAIRVMGGKLWTIYRQVRP